MSNNKHLKNVRPIRHCELFYIMDRYVEQKTIHARGGLLKISQSLHEILLSLQRMSDVVEELSVVSVHSQTGHEYRVFCPPGTHTLSNRRRHEGRQ